jgi:hypothetical protein
VLKRSNRASGGIAARENPWSRRRRVKLADLMNEPWALSPPDSLGGTLTADDFRAAGLDLPRATVISYTDIARLALAAPPQDHARAGLGAPPSGPESCPGGDTATAFASMAGMMLHCSE